MSTTLSFVYNGNIYEINKVNISSYEWRPIYAEDGYTLIRYEIHVSGSGLIADGLTTYSELQDLNRAGPGQVSNVLLSCQTTEGTELLFNVAAPDALRGPLVTITTTEIAGIRAAICNFSVMAAKAYSSEDSGYPIISHRWTSRFSLDAAGHITRTVSGTLVVNLGATAAGTSAALNGTVAQVITRAPWADLFRRAILPVMTMEGNWRRDSQTFAYNETGNTLIYEITDSNARTALPDSAFTGSADFTYERNASALTYATLKFNCDLEGDVTGDVRHMIWSAVVLAQSRINFVRCKIMRLVVTEQDMFKKAKIRFELEALSPAVGTDIVGVVNGSVPLAQYIGKFFTVGRSCPTYSDPYGPYRGVAGIPHWYGNGTSAKAQTTQTIAVSSCIAVITDYCSPGTPTISISIPDTELAAANATMSTGPFETPIAQFDNQGVVTSVDQAVTSTKVNTQTRMHRLQTLYTEGSDFVFQTGKAVVTVEETTIVKRTNIPPVRTFRPIPSGFVVVTDDWKVNFGEVDQGGNRTFIGVYTRTLESYDGGGATSNGYSTVAGRRQWWPTGANPSVAAPLTLGYDPTMQTPGSSVLALGNDAQAYQVGTPQDYA